MDVDKPFNVRETGTTNHCSKKKVIHLRQNHFFLDTLPLKLVKTVEAEFFNILKKLDRFMARKEQVVAIVDAR